MQHSALSPDFFCDVRPDGERVVVRLGGELDLAVSPRIAATVDELVGAGCARIVVDLRGVSFLDSSGVHALVSARRAAGHHGCALSLVRGARHVHRVFELTATESLVAFDDARMVA
jgi:anti-sigma B factor antagonist